MLHYIFFERVLNTPLLEDVGKKSKINNEHQSIIINHRWAMGNDNSNFINFTRNAKLGAIHLVRTHTFPTN